MHVKNLSTLTDKAALLLAADYYNDRDGAELIKAMKDLNVGIKKEVTLLPSSIMKTRR